MSLVNSFINQIGRELAKDVYRKTKATRFVKPTKFAEASVSKSIDFNKNFLNEVDNFELAAYDKVTLRQLINLLEKSKEIEPNSFDFQQCYITLDNKIDFCKQHFDIELQDKLEELDQLNEANYRKALLSHKIYVSDFINKLETEINKENETIPIILSFFGFNPIYYKERSRVIFNHLLGAVVGLPCIIYGALMYLDPINYHGNSKVDTLNDINSIKQIALIIIAFGTIFYLPILYGSFKRIFDKNQIKIHKN